MRAKTKFILAVAIFLIVLSVVRLERSHVLTTSFSNYVTSGEDLIVLKKWVYSLFPEDERLQVVNYTEETEFLYDSLQPYKNGVVITTPTTSSVQATKSGLVIFTGITKSTGKTITVMYDDGEEVTYGFIGSFSKLPYTSVKKGDVLALMEDETLFLKVKRDGIELTPTDFPAYLSGNLE